MKFDSTITITVVIAISAIISPIITTLLNNHHLYKMRKLDDETELRKTSYFYKRGIFEDYMRYAGQCVTHATSDALENYGATYALASFISQMNCLIKSLTSTHLSTDISGLTP